MDGELSSQIEAEKNDRLWLILRARLYERKVKDAFQFFRRNKIEPILIKGWAAAQEYPEKHERFYGDIDFCVDPCEYERGLRLLETDEGKRHLIDLHNGFRHLDTHQWEDLYENSVLKEIDGEPIRVLRAEDHLRILCVHWLNDGGAEKNRLLDIYHILENRKATFDWNRCLGGLSETRSNWVKKAIGAARKYYHLDVSGMPFEEQETNLPSWFVKTIESEWKSSLKLTPLHLVLGDRGQLLRQIGKRLSPNAVQATIEMEAKIDDAPRIRYQIASVFRRLRPSVGRVYREIKHKYSKHRKQDNGLVDEK